MFSYSIVLSIALSIEHAELLEEGGVEGTFSETILALREDQMRKTATCSRTGLQPYEHGTLSLSFSRSLLSRRHLEVPKQMEHECQAQPSSTIRYITSLFTCTFCFYKSTYFSGFLGVSALSDSEELLSGYPHAS